MPRSQADRDEDLALGRELERKDAEIERLRTACEWRPIRSAPRGEMFIYFEPRDGKRCIGLAYLAKDGGWRDSEGDWSRRLQPTHWMPLPSPPQ